MNVKEEEQEEEEQEQEQERSIVRRDIVEIVLLVATSLVSHTHTYTHLLLVLANAISLELEVEDGAVVRSDLGSFGRLGAHCCRTLDRASEPVSVQ